MTEEKQYKPCGVYDYPVVLASTHVQDTRHKHFNYTQLCAYCGDVGQYSIRFDANHYGWYCPYCHAHWHFWFDKTKQYVKRLLTE